MFSRLSQLFSNPLQLVYVLPGVLIGLTVHEWAHAYSANRLGDPTAKNLGRMTLNPIAHIDPFGFLCLLLVGFGWAKPVPINSRNFRNYKRDEIIVSLSGIGMNLVTAFVFTFVFFAGVFFLNLGDNEAFLSIFTGIVIINLSLAVFNLLPIYPLDGSHVFECLFGRRMPRFVMFMHQYGQWILIALLITGVFGNILSVVVNAAWSLFSKAAIGVLGRFMG